MSDDDKDQDPDVGEEEEKPKKKPRVKKEPVDISNIDWNELARNNEVEKQKLPALRAFCKQNSLPVGGNKPALVQRILEHLGAGKDEPEDGNDEGDDEGED